VQTTTAGRIRLGRRHLEGGAFEFGRLLMRESLREVEHDAHLGDADLARRKRSQGRDSRPREVAGLGEEATRGCLVHDERRRELGNERSRGELPLDRRRGIRDPFDLGREHPGRLDTPELLGLCRPDHPLQPKDLLQLGSERGLRRGCRSGAHDTHSTTTHRH
jgi:hypothetical protein